MEHAILLRRHERPVITETNFAPIVQIITWLLLGFMILSTTARFLTKSIIARRLLGLDDLFTSLALLLAVGQTACVLLSTDFGLARTINDLTEHQIGFALKTEFVGDLLYLLSIWAAKISVLCFLDVITPAKSRRRVLQASGLVITVWMVTAVFASSFQCALPSTWDYVHNRCFDRLAFMRYLGISNILTEMIVIVLPAMIILPLQTTMSSKVTMVASFSARVIVIAAIILQLIELNTWFKHPDITLYIWPYQVCTQCVQALSIMTGCLPYLKPFFEGSGVGALRTENATIRQYGREGTKTQITNNNSLENGHIRVTRDIEVTSDVPENDTQSNTTRGLELQYLGPTPSLSRI